MKTAGAVLKNARMAKGLTLSQVETATKIKVKVLEKIESDQISQFSSFGHVLGLVKNYGEFLGLDSDYLTALFRRQVNVPQASKPPTAKFGKVFVPFRSQILALFLLIAVFGYLVFQLANLRTGPALEVLQPPNGAILKLSKIQILGKTEPEAQVSVNGQKVPTNLSGEFSTEFELAPGINLIEISAKKGEGFERTVVRKVEFSQ